MEERRMVAAVLFERGVGPVEMDCVRPDELDGCPS
jgi:hypothetical protein